MDNSKELHIGEGKLLGEVIKKLNLLLREGSVTTDKINNKAVTTEKIAELAITALKIADHAIETSKIANSAVTTEKLSDDSITTDKLVDGAVTMEKIANRSINTRKLLDKSVVTEILDDNSVTTLKVVDKAITEDKLAKDSVTTEKILNNTITTEKLSDNAVTTEKLNDRSITTDKLEDSSVSTSKVIDHAVTWDKMSPEVQKAIESSIGINLTTTIGKVFTNKILARNEVPLKYRVKGLLITYILNGEWVTEQYQGTGKQTDDWQDDNLWEYIADMGKLFPIDNRNIYDNYIGKSQREINNDLYSHINMGGAILRLGFDETTGDFYGETIEASSIFVGAESDIDGNVSILIKE